MIEHGRPGFAGRAFVYDRAPREGLCPTGFNPCRLRTPRPCRRVLRALKACGVQYGLATATPSRGLFAALCCAYRRTTGRAVVSKPISIAVLPSLIASCIAPKGLLGGQAVKGARHRASHGIRPHPVPSGCGFRAPTAPVTLSCKPPKRPPKTPHK